MSAWFRGHHGFIYIEEWLEMAIELSKYERESHMRILEDMVSKVEFTGVQAKTVFVEPALVLRLNRQPSNAGINILKNTVDLKIDGVENGLNVYLVFGESAYRIGMIERNIDPIYNMEEVLRGYDVKMYLMDGADKRKVVASDFITTLSI